MRDSVLGNFADGHFPRRTLPRWKVSRRNFPDGQLNISPNHIFHFRNGKVIGMN